MAEIGHFGNELVFSTSDQRILSFHGFSQRVSGRWSSHAIIGDKPHKEYNGPGERKISFKMTLDALHGVKPRAMLEKLEEMAESGTVEYLVIGGRAIGSNQFYILEISENWDVIYNRGELAIATLSVTMEEYI